MQFWNFFQENKKGSQFLQSFEVILLFIALFLYQFVIFLVSLINQITVALTTVATFLCCKYCAKCRENSFTWIKNNITNTKTNKKPLLESYADYKKISRPISFLFLFQGFDRKSMSESRLHLFLLYGFFFCKIIYFELLQLTIYMTVSLPR